MNGEYYIGLDLGTSSVGWAVTDPNYNLLRLRGHDAWGVRLFEEGQTANDRRTSRGARRRIDRTQARQRYIRKVLLPLIEPIDPEFYTRREESMLWEEDKASKTKYSIFGKNGISDREFYRKYPTISHLIVDMIHHPEAHTDPREYAIVIEYKFKHRGNFLLSGKLDGESNDFEEMYQNLLRRMNEAVLDADGEELSAQNYPEADKVRAILTDRNLAVKEKADKLLKLFIDSSEERQFSKDEKNKIKVLFGFLSGKKEDLFKIWPDHPARNDVRKTFSFSLREKDLEEALNDILDQISETEMDLLEAIAQIFDWVQLEEILKNRDGHTFAYLAEARVSLYEQHRTDLKQLKRLIKTAAPEKYNSLFREYPSNNTNYSRYVGSVNSTRTGKVRGKKGTQQDFYEEVTKILNNLDLSRFSNEKRKELEKEKDEILRKIDLDQFMPKQMSAKNGVIPNQLHAKELKKILENASNLFPEFLEKDESGKTLSERISMLFEFRIPYYVGPVGQGKEPGTSWVVWNENEVHGPVYPWNLEDKVDQKATSRAFIDRMVRSCTYLPEYRALPDHSLLYEKFKVLNELNNLKIDGNLLDPELKHKLFEKEFLKGKKVTQKKIRKFLIEEGLMDPDQASNASITGIDGDFTNRLGTEKFFCEVLGTDHLTDVQRAMAEKIIYWSTVYDDGAPFLKEDIQSKFPELTDKQVRRILGNRFTGWGRISKQFLEMEGSDSHGNRATVMGFLWQTNDNLMQILSDKYSFRTDLNEISVREQKSLFEISHEDLEDMYLSGPVKRMIWQTIRILREIIDLMGKAPKKVFIEMARDKGKTGKRTQSRKEHFKELYKSIKDNEKDWMSKIESINESQFRTRKVYLYLSQMGCDAYTGEEINLTELLNSNSKYDIDHIYPKCRVKDDSIENNLVLTTKNFNNKVKGDHYPVPVQARSRMYQTWKFWLDQGLITQEKFNRLTRREEFTDDELAGFINRQLVETRQGTKVLASILEKGCPETKIIYSKASNVSAFREKFEIPKLRDLNDLHHAVDAYLNIVVGNVYSVKFTDNPIKFIKEYRKGKQKYNMDKLYESQIIREKENAWTPGDEGTILTVKKIVFKGTPLITYRAVPYRGPISDSQLRPARERNKKIYCMPRKEGIVFAPEKYGFYRTVHSVQLFLVEFQKKNKKKRMLQPLYVNDAKHYCSKEELEKYCVNSLGLEDPSVRLINIPPKSLIRINGYPVWLLGRTGDHVRTKSAVELILPDWVQKYLAKSIRLEDNGEYSFYLKEASKAKNVKIYDLLIEKFSTPLFMKLPKGFGENAMANKLLNARKKFVNLEIEEQIEIIYRIIKSFSSGADEFKKRWSEFRILPDPRVNKVMSEWNKLTGDDNQEAGKCVLIYQSVTGLYTTEIDLLTV